MSDWMSNPDTVEYVKSLLYKSGIPLEVRTAQVCQQFVEDHNDNPAGLNVSTERVLYYTDPTGNTLREVDRFVKISAWVTLGPDSYYALDLEIPIECKHRDHVEVFGFPTEPFKDSDTAVPFFGDLGSSLLQELIRTGYPEAMLDEPVTLVRFLEFKNPKKGERTPDKLSDEDVPYKVGLALYDYIKAQHIHITPTQRSDTADELIETQGLIDQTNFEYTHFWRFAQSWRLYKDKVWKREDQQLFEEYNRSVRPDGSMFLSTTVSFPILVTNGPLHLVEFDDNNDIKNFATKPFLLTSVPVSGWPDQTPYYLANPGKEFLLTVTNEENLGSVLDMLLTTFLDMVNTVADNPDLAVRAPLEHDVYTYLLWKARDNAVWTAIR